MSNSNALNFIIQVKDEASATFKKLEEQISDLAVVTRALQNANEKAGESHKAHGHAAHEAADELREASYVLRLFGEGAEALIDKLEGAQIYTSPQECRGNRQRRIPEQPRLAALGCLCRTGEHPCKSGLPTLPRTARPIHNIHYSKSDRPPPFLAFLSSPSDDG
jgi:hypothetical protein